MNTRVKPTIATYGPDIVMYVLSGIHVAVWLYILVGGLIFTRHIPYIVLGVIPLFFIVQSLPCHLLLYAKLQYVQRHKHMLGSIPSYQLTNDDRQAIQQVHVTCGFTKNELIEAWKVLKYYAYAFVVPKWLDAGRSWFDKHSFMNPLSLQGMLIIALLINSFAYFVLHL